LPSLPDLNELHPHRPFVGSAHRTEQAGDRKDDHEDDYKKRTTDNVQPTLSFLKIEGRPDQLVLDARKPKEGQKALLQAH
jgi:hypothetical protein